MTWDEVLSAFQRERPGQGQPSAAFIEYLKEVYADPVRLGLTRVYATGKSYDYKDTIKAYGDRLFRWDGQLKRWYADVRDSEIDRVTTEIRQQTYGAVEIKVDTDYKRASPPPASAGPGAAHSSTSPQGVDEIPEEEIPF